MRRYLPEVVFVAALLLSCGPGETTIDEDTDAGGAAGSPTAASGGSGAGGLAGQRAGGASGSGNASGGRGGSAGAAGSSPGTGGVAGTAGSTPGTTGGITGAGGIMSMGGATAGGSGGTASGMGGMSTGGSAGAVGATERSKFHLYLMIGQSNMEGTGTIFDEDVIAPPKVVKFTKDMQWVAGNEPTAIGRIGRSVGATGVSMGRTFAIEMMASQTDPDVKIGLMNLAVSGSPIQSWMDPPPVRTSDPTRPFDTNYAKMLPYLRAALKDGVLKGVLWHQGEANGSGDIPVYLPQVIANLRKEVNDPNLPVVVGEVGITTLTDNKNKALAKVASEVPRVGLATCENLLFKEGMIGVHYDTPSYREYGRRYAVVMKKLLAASP